MQEGSQTIKRKFKLVCPNSKSQKKYQTITRCETKEVPRVKRKAISLYKIDSVKEYALPINKEEIKFQFWGCAQLPKKIKVRNPFLNEQKRSDRLLTGQSKNLLRHYLVRKTSQSKRTLVINPQNLEINSLVSAPNATLRSPQVSNLTLKKSRTLLSQCKSSDFDSKFFISTMITDPEDIVAERQLSSLEFRPITENNFMQKMHDINERINAKGNLLAQIKTNMNMIRFKKMTMFEI